MRYKKGSKVEILCNEEVPSGSWRCGEIISGNGRNYTVRNDVYPGATDDEIVERVSRKSVRPCPPLVKLTDDWVPGEVLEVFHNYSWKMATVCKVLGRNSVVVRLVGSSQEFKVKKFDLRVRQCWQDNEWIVIGKGFATYVDGKQSERLNLKYVNDSGCEVKETSARVKLQLKDNSFDAQDNICFQASRNVSSRTLKRSSPCWYSQIEAHESAQKFLAAEKEGRSHRVAASLSPEKVEAVASTREMLDEKHIHASSNNITTRFFEMDVERETPSGGFGCLGAISLGAYDADNITCSVGSCSVTGDSPYVLTSHSSRFEDNEVHYSDAESFCQLGCGKELCLPPSIEELGEEIHRRELHAYRCTIMALHASGPLNWEQETLVTNLRILLHISNDEHLMELRNLISSSTSIPIS